LLDVRACATFPASAYGQFSTRRGGLFWTSVNITELKRNPSAVIEAADGESVAVLVHNKPVDDKVVVVTVVAVGKRDKGIVCLSAKMRAGK